MSKLTEMKCTACRGDSPRATDAEINEFMRVIPDWKIEERGGVKQLERVFQFDDFKQALDFTNRIGDLAEAEDHHPALLTEWGKVTVTWWTHKVKGLHQNDFIMAAKSDQAFAEKS